jgi:hypothetical protein
MYILSSNLADGQRRKSQSGSEGGEAAGISSLAAAHAPAWRESEKIAAAGRRNGRAKENRW